MQYKRKVLKIIYRNNNFIFGKILNFEIHYGPEIADILTLFIWDFQNWSRASLANVTLFFEIRFCSFF